VRIALFTTSFPSNSETAVNAGVAVKDFAEALTALGHEVAVLTPYKRGARHEFQHANTVWFPWLGSQDTLTHIGMSPIGLLQLGSVVVMGSVAALRLLRRFRANHVLCFWVFPCGLWARLAQLWIGVPYSVWALGSDIRTLRKLPGFPYILRWIGRGASRRFADGMALGQEFQAIVGSRVDFLATSRVLAVPAGVPVGEGGYYLFLGRYHATKGIDLLIEAVGKVKDQLPPGFRLRVHGSGPLEKLIRARVRGLGLDSLVEIRGTIGASEVSTVLRRACGLIIPSRIESIPLVLSEAIQMELPIMVTDVGDMGTLVRRHGAGLVCRPDVNAMAETLLRFVSSPVPGGSPALLELLDIRRSAERFLSEIAAEPEAVE
jgi:glycosyltransferase involved in cell wall biosynthesis